MSCFDSDGCETVSYTHLDVYKRQVYNIFFNSIVNNGRNVLESPLKYRDGAYEIDFGDLEEKLADPQTTMMILCNPQNPVGKIWDRETLARIGALCRKHHVIVLSDEIHCDLTAPGREYIPFASVSEDCRENSVTCLAPTKAFNLAGLQTAAIMVPNEALRNKMHRAINTDEVAEPNAFAVEAAVAAFTKGEAWLDALRAYIEENRRLAKRWLAERIPKLWLVDGEATYLPVSYTHLDPLSGGRGDSGRDGACALRGAESAGAGNGCEPVARVPGMVRRRCL